jgi:uncharacterized membrane protein YraQ (UPF0718 family)/YHS domain-containing protein
VIATTHTFIHGVGDGLREALAMLWITWWPLVLGFTLSGFVQSLLPRDGLRAQLGRTNATSVAKASALGVISSSCSYAASAMARALFARGASWTNSIVFMVASTNLVIELGIVLYLLLGWPFVAAQFVGGALMIAMLGFTMHVVFSRRYQNVLRERVERDSPPPMRVANETWRQRVRERENYRLAARFTVGDLTMLRKELVAGFVVAGFIMADVPNRWYADVFVHGHGFWTLLENVTIAPLLAVISFVCSVGNIPLAAALWAHGVAFGGVISFVFADLVTLPLLFIYRRFYGTGATLRLFALLWFVMSLGGLVVDRLFHLASWIPTSHHVRFASGDFPLGWDLALNVVATVVLASVWLLARTSRRSAAVATDPICGMTVDTSAPGAVRHVDHVDYYFCSPRCAGRFDERHASRTPSEPSGDAMDPV